MKSISNILILGSASRSRQLLLQSAGIKYVPAGHTFEETSCDWGMPIEQLVKTIATSKMDHVVIPQEFNPSSMGSQSVSFQTDVQQESQPRAVQLASLFVLTADTLGVDREGVIHGKPTSREDAYDKVRAHRKGARAVTAFCLSKRTWHNGSWVETDRITDAISADFVFNVPEEWLDSYLDAIGRYLEVAGGIAIEGFGFQFLESVHGSYTTILGLPVMEVRVALEKLGFFGI